MVKCPICGKKLKTENGLRLHTQAVHNKGGNPGGGTAPDGGKKAKAKATRSQRIQRSIARAEAGPEFAKLGALGITPQLLGKSPGGRAWVMRALHPSGDFHVSCAGIPDRTTQHTAKPMYQTVAKVTPDASITTDTWDCIIWVVPADSTSVVVRSGPAGTDFRTPAPHTHTVLFAGRQAKDNSTTWAYDQATEARTCHKGVTVELIAPRLKDQGDVYTCQVSRKPQFLRTRTDGTLKADYEEYAITVPADEQEIMGNPAISTKWQARDGVYMPMRFVDPNHQFQTTSGPLTTTTDGTPTNFQFNKAVHLYNSDGTLIASEPASNESDLLKYWNGYMDNTQTGVILFRNMSKEASLSIKVMKGEEVVVKSNSTLLPFQTPSPGSDPFAMDMYNELSNQLPVSYYAKENNTNGIWDTIKQIAHKVASYVAYVPGVPGMLGRVVADLTAPVTKGS